MESLIYNRTSKSFYNASDLNRVESWIQYLGGVLDSAGIPSGIRSRESWASTNIPRMSSFVRIREDIYRLRDSFYSAMPDWRDFDINSKTTGLDEWNAWEWDLNLINTYAQGMIDNMEMFRQAEHEDSNPLWMESKGLMNT